MSLVTTEKQKTFAEILDGIFDYKTSEMIKRKHLRGKRYSRNHADIQRRQYENHIRPFFCDKNPRKIKATTVEDWVDILLAKKLKAISIAHLFSTLNILFKELIRMEYIDRNPLEGVERFSKKTAEKDIYRDDEIETLFSSPDSYRNIWNKSTPYYVICRLASETGIRMGEAQALLKDNVKETSIIIAHSWDRKYGLKDTKTGETREIPIFPEMRRWLEKQMQENKTDYVFALPGGKGPVDHKAVHKHLYRALRKIGITEEEREKRSLSFHNFRHTLNTRLINSGAPLMLVQSITGHRDVKMSEHYYHPKPEDFEKAFGLVFKHTNQGEKDAD